MLQRANACLNGIPKKQGARSSLVATKQVNSALPTSNQNISCSGYCAKTSRLPIRSCIHTGAVESIRKAVESNTIIQEKVSASVELPLSKECQRILVYAADPQ